MEAFVLFICNSLAIYSALYLLPGVQVDSYMTAIMASVSLGLISSFLHPILILFSLPTTIISTGLFTLAVMPIIVWIASLIMPGFVLDGFLWAVVFGLILAIINSFIQSLEL